MERKAAKYVKLENTWTFATWRDTKRFHDFGKTFSPTNYRECTGGERNKRYAKTNPINTNNNKTNAQRNKSTNALNA